MHSDKHTCTHIHTKLEYNERIVNVDCGTFCLLVFTTAGAASTERAKFLQQLCDMFAHLDRMH